MHFSRSGVLLILVLSVALAIGVYLVNRDQGMGSGVWPNYSAEVVQSIEIATRTERYSLVKEPTGWVVRQDGAEPDALPTPADQSKVEALLEAIAHSRPAQNLGPLTAADATVYGFSSPAVRILLRTATLGLREVLLTFGNETPTGVGLYAQSSLAQDTAFLLDANILHQVDKSSDHYFDYRLLDLRTDDAQHLLFTGATGAQWELERAEDIFVFQRPESLKGATVSSSEVRLFLHNLSAITADSILSKADRQPAGHPGFTLEITTTKGTEPLRLEVFSPGEAEQAFGRSSRHPIGFQLDREKARSLFRLAFDMQWRGVITVDSAHVERARIYSVMGNQTLTAEKTPTGWEDRERGTTVAGLDMTLWRLKELRFEAEPVGRLAYPAVQRLVLELLAKDAKVLYIYTFYADPRLPPDQCWLKVGAEEMFYPVGNQIVEELQGYMPSRAVRAPGS